MVDQDPELQRWISNLQTGISPEESFRCLFERYHHRLMGFFARRGFSPEDCRDLTQETFLGTYSSIGSYRGQARFETWLFKIAANVYRKRLRRRLADKRAGKEVSFEEPADSERVPLGERLAEDPVKRPGPEEATLRRERSRRLRQAVDELPDQMHRCLVLRIYQGLSYKEIAAVMRLSIDTVKAHLFQARQRLREQLFEDPNHPGGGMTRS